MTIPTGSRGWSASVLPSWLDTEWLLPTDVRDRVRAAADAAHALHGEVEAFTAAHWSVFQEYAALTERAGPRDVWEVLDQVSGYTGLWVSLLMSEAVLATTLDLVRPSAIGDRRRRRNDRS
jgi:hypothetical protein